MSPPYFNIKVHTIRSIAYIDVYQYIFWTFTVLTLSSELLLDMSDLGAGFEFPSQELSWLKRDVLLFACSIGCTADELHFLYVCVPVIWLSSC
jgi:hypothetical protein